MNSINEKEKKLNIALEELKNLDISNPETREKYIHSLYSIFSKLDPRFIILYETKLLEIKNSNIERKHKFKIMDILDLKK